MALADVDDDGDTDLAATNPNNSPSVSIVRNDGTGVFGTPVIFTGPSNARRVLATDVDNDGDAKFAVVASHTVYLYGNNSSGGFKLITSIRPNATASPRALARRP